MEVVIAPVARNDIAGILARTEVQFGPRTLKRYAKLIAAAIGQVAENPNRPAAGSDRKSPSIAEPTILL